MEQPYSNPKLFKEVLQQLQNNKSEKIQELSKYSLEQLAEMKKYYYDWAKGAEGMGAKESAIINSEKWKIIEAVIRIKQNNDKNIKKEEIKIVEGK